MPTSCSQVLSKKKRLPPCDSPHRHRSRLPRGSQWRTPSRVKSRRSPAGIVGLKNGGENIFTNPDKALLKREIPENYRMCTFGLFDFPLNGIIPKWVFHLRIPKRKSTENAYPGFGSTLLLFMVQKSKNDSWWFRDTSYLQGLIYVYLCLSCSINSALCWFPSEVQGICQVQ